MRTKQQKNAVKVVGIVAIAAILFSLILPIIAGVK